MKRHTSPRSRRAATLVFAAVLMTILVGMVAFGVDVGYMVLVRTQLQAAADSAAMAGASALGEDFQAVYQLANQYASYHTAGGETVTLAESDVEIGVWDSETRTFTPQDGTGNAVRITARRENASLFFARIFGIDTFSTQVQAVAMANPRDIAFVIDLSGSMNDDTEPAWATKLVNQKFAPEGYPTIGNDLMNDVYADFGFGAFPGTLQYIGEPLGVAQDSYAYAEMTKDNGPLAQPSIPAQYRIDPSDDEPTRKLKAYSWMIDNQIAVVMPNAKPTPDSTDAASYAYWEKYLDYIIDDQKVKGSDPSKKKKKKKKGKKKKKKSKKKKKKSKKKSKKKKGGGSKKKKKSGGSSKKKKKGGGGSSGGGSSPPPPPAGFHPVLPQYPSVWQTTPQRWDTLAWQLHPFGPLAVLPGGTRSLWPAAALGASKGTPPYNRGWLPPNQDPDRITKFNNPNKTSFPSASSSLVKAYRNKIGYLTYVQFMMDFGRDLQPVSGQYVPLSTQSPLCPYHDEDVNGQTFSFPPREQPMHAGRRAIIRAIQIVQEQNQGVSTSQADWVAVISFDALDSGNAVIHQPLTADYLSAMNVCTTLQAVGDKLATTATEGGLIEAKEHLKPAAEGGYGRNNTNKVVILLTDGMPNLYVSDPADISQYIADNPSSYFYNNGAYWADAPLMQAHMMQAEGYQLFPVGVGLGTDYDFMDRMANLGGTANEDGQAPRGSGNPAMYENVLVEIFEEIIKTPKVRLVQ